MDDPVLEAILEGLNEGWLPLAVPRDWFVSKLVGSDIELEPDEEPVAYDKERGLMYVTLFTFTRVQEYLNDRHQETHGDT